MRKSIAFTLAETLIVIGIIGVIAALTLPNLSDNTNNKETVARVSKAYSAFNEALGRAVASYGPTTKWDTSSSWSNGETSTLKRINQRIMENLKISKDCSKNQIDCFPEEIKYLNGTSFLSSFRDSKYYTYTLADGTSVASFLTSPETLTLLIDIDGVNKGSSTVGKDIFAFKLIRDNEDSVTAYPYDTTYSKSFNTGLSASKWIIENGNMDYLKANSDGSCKNSSVVLLINSVSNISCK